MDYTEANIEKKHEVAGRMKYKMNGGKPRFVKGMQYDQNGKSTTTGRGMKYKQAGPGKEHTGGQKATQANKHPSFSSVYTQNGKKE